MTTPIRGARAGGNAARSARVPARAPRRAPLPPGGLRALAWPTYRPRPHSDFSPGEIARVLGRSRGAVTNACKHLTGLGLAQRTQQTPQRYQATPPTRLDISAAEPETAAD